MIIQAPGSFESVSRFIAHEVVGDYVKTIKQDPFLLTAAPVIAAAAPLGLAAGYAGVVAAHLLTVIWMMLRAAVHLTISPITQGRRDKKFKDNVDSLQLCASLGEDTDDTRRST